MQGIFKLPRRVFRSTIVPGQHTHGELSCLHQLFAGSSSHVEVGTFCGASALASTGLMLPNSRVWLVDPIVPSPSGLGSEWLRAVLTATLPYIESRGELDLRVQHLHCGSADAVKMFAPESVDTIYIDGRHLYRGIKEDIELWRPIVRPGGILAGHDFCPEWPGVVRAVRELLPGYKIERERVWSWRKP